MPYTLLLHIVGEEAVLGDAEQLPDPADSFISVTNIRKRDGKDVSFADPNATIFIFPWNRVNFVEVLQAAEEEEIVGFVRE
jgi:hypothetical protein